MLCFAAPNHLTMATLYSKYSNTLSVYALVAALILFALACSMDLI